MELCPELATGLLVALFFFVSFLARYSPVIAGYYRYPDVGENQAFFKAQGGISKVYLSGRWAQGISSQPEEELLPRFSTDVRAIAFSARSVGPAVAYTMPVSGEDAQLDNVFKFLLDQFRKDRPQVPPYLAFSDKSCKKDTKT